MRTTQLLVMTLATALVLVACGGGSDSGTTNPGEPGATTTAGTGDPVAPDTTTAGSDPSSGQGGSGSPGGGTGDSWWEVDGKRYEIEILVRCERVIDENLFDAPAHDDDFWVIASVGPGGNQWLLIEYTGADGWIAIEHTQGSPIENADAILALGEEVSREGNRVRGGPFTAWFTTTGSLNEVHVPMSLDVEIPSDLYPDCEGAEDL